MNTYDPMYSGGYNYGAPSQTNSWGQTRQYGNYMPGQSQPRLNTNAIFVTSLEEALIKTDMRNSDMIYFNQDKNEFYRVRVDMEGKKTWAIFVYTLPNQEDTSPATKADIQALLTRIEALEGVKETKPAPRKKKEVPDNAESDG